MIGFLLLASLLAVPDPIRLVETANADLTRAAAAIGDVEHCAAKSPRWEPKFETLSRKEFEVQDRVAGFLGRRVAPSFSTLAMAEPATPPICSDVFVEAASTKAQAAFADVNRLADGLEAATGGGAWLGLFPLCAGTVRSELLPKVGDGRAGQAAAVSG